MEKFPLISVIVPVYGVENYISQCIESIVKQTYRNLEIILIEDASPDRCADICDDWASKDSRITVLHSLENGGAGKSRNKGIEIAKGEWIVLVDGDDYLHNNMISHLFGLLESDVDLVECSIINTTLDQADFTYEESVNLICCIAQEALEKHIDDKCFCQTPPNKLYKAEIIKKIPFPEGKLIDDEFWTYRVIGECGKLKHSPNKLYAYRQQEGSVMHKKYSIKRLQALDAKLQRLKYIEEKFPELQSKAKINYVQTCIFHGQMIELCIKGNEKREARVQVNEYFSKVQLSRYETKGLSKSHRLWIDLAKKSFIATCKVKNLLKVGL